MKVLICKQGLFGGTDKLLDRLCEWLKKKNYIVSIFCNKAFETNNYYGHYDLAVVPSSQIGDISLLSDKGVKVSRILIWMMGMGAFSDAYYNYPAVDIFDRILCFLYKKKAKKTFKWLISHRAIVFTDYVGAYSSYKILDIKKPNITNDDIIPIAIECQKSNLWKDKHDLYRKGVIKLAWIGRVSRDFKEIPITKLMEDIQHFEKGNTIEIELTIVGDGDAIDRIKEESIRKNIKTKFINNIPYEELNCFIVNEVDLLVAMGTSALDGAKVGCPTVIISPVRYNDVREVYYRWIYDSVGFSLGEFPNSSIETNQKRSVFSEIMSDYVNNNLIISKNCYLYTQIFNYNAIFEKLIKRELPETIDTSMKRNIENFRIMKRRKRIVKNCIRKKS